jgi:hypothetical protein
MADNNNDDDSAIGDLEVIYMLDEILTIGLQLMKYSEKKINKWKRTRKLDQFNFHYGSFPIVVATIWEDLQTTSIDEAHVPPNKLNINYFLMAMHFLKMYPKEMQKESIWSLDRQTCRDWIWFYVEKIRALKAEKIKWPDDNFKDDIWAITVDGIHTKTNKPMHPTLSFDKEYFSFKYGRSGLSYELGIAIAHQKCVWMKGPNKPGVYNDIKACTDLGLLEKLKATGKRAIGDSAYSGYPDIISTENPHHNPPAVIEFKRRALSRHENFNNLLKRFDCLSGTFRHGVSRLGDCFDAVVVICQYQIESTSPLYDVLIQDILDKFPSAGSAQV